MDEHEGEPEGQAGQRERRMTELEQRVLARRGGDLVRGTGGGLPSSVSGTAANLAGVLAAGAGPAAAARRLAAFPVISRDTPAGRGHHPQDQYGNSQPGSLRIVTRRSLSAASGSPRQARCRPRQGFPPGAPWWTCRESAGRWAPGQRPGQRDLGGSAAEPLRVPEYQLVAQHRVGLGEAEPSGKNGTTRSPASCTPPARASRPIDQVQRILHARYVGVLQCAPAGARG